MDTLTHALSGALLARASAPAAPGATVLPLRRRLVVGFLAAAAPDLDFVIGYVGPIEYLLYHRGVTHSLILLPLWAWLLAQLFSFVWRRDRSWHAYFGIVAMALGIHITGDWITSFGTMLLAPFSDARFGIGTTFIIDLWFTAIIAAGLAACALLRASRVPALAGLAVLCAYVGYQAVLQQQAIEWGEAHARSSAPGNPLVTAQPRPVSPYNWMVVAREGENVRYAFVNLRRREPLAAPPGSGLIRRLDAAYLPPQQAQWVHASRFGNSAPERAAAREAWSRPEFRFFRWFAQEPVLLRVETGNPSTCVFFQDLRFFTPGRGTWPFRYGMCREEDGPWRVNRLSGDNRRITVP